MLVELLSSTADVPESKLMSLAATASKRYKTYQVPKKTGGDRTIHHPSRDIKAIQRWLTKVLINRFPVHEAATAYRKGGGIRANASLHQHSKYTTRFDFADFFPSFKAANIRQFISEGTDAVQMPLSSRDVRFVTNIVCRYGQLTIGAPSSPAITNAMMFEFDRQVSDHCRSNGLIYSRYADDVFISSNAQHQLTGLGGLIFQVANEATGVSLQLNGEKTAYLSKKYHRSVTGVVVTPQHRLSVGRARKREIKALIHKLSVGALTNEEKSYLRGLFAFAIDIEPEFEGRLIQKYGPQIIAGLRGHTAG